MRVVDDVKDNELNNFHFDYCCSIFGAVCNLASATNDDILDFMHNQTGHGNKICSWNVYNQKLLQGLKFQKFKSENFINPIIICAMYVRYQISHGIVSINLQHPRKGIGRLCIL